MSSNINETIQNIYNSPIDKNEGITKKIYSLYGDLGKKYFSKYGGSVFIAITMVVMIGGIIMYINVKNNLTYVKDNWNELKCDPRYAPFAGMVIPDNTKGLFEAGTENANFCFNRILHEVSDEAMIPYNSIMNVYNQLNDKILNLANSIRNLSNTMRDNIKDIFEEQYGRLMNSVIPIQQLIITVKDIMAKMKGAMVTSVYPMLGLYFTLKSTIESVYNLIVKILIGLAATIVVLWIFPFTWGAAASMTAIFIIIMIPTVIMSTMMGEIFHLSPKGLPKSPKRRHCFGGDYSVSTQRGNIPIKNLVPGDCINNIAITTIMKLSADEETMYNLNDGLYVSGKHKIFNPYTNIFNDVCDDGRFTPSHDFKDKYIYCFNTSSKIIRLGNYVFLDYDELNNTELTKIITEFKLLYPTLNFNKSTMHKMFEGGLYPTTIIRKKDNNHACILTIKIGDELEEGNKVIGKVFIHNDNLLYNIKLDGGRKLMGVNPNIIYYDNTGNIKSSIYNKKRGFERENKYVYNIHLLTTKGYFYIGKMNNSIKVGDYNTCLDYFINKQ